MAQKKLTFFTRRWGSLDSYDVERTDTGWHVHHITYEGDCNKRGEPKLYEAMNHDAVHYPAALGDYMERLWEGAGNGKMDVQEGLNELGAWISACETATPGGKFDT